MDDLNPDVYIGPQVMVIAFKSLALHYHTKWTTEQQPEWNI